MKISIGMKLQQGAWGGGNQFGITLSKTLQEKNIKVSYDLKSFDLDIIILSASSRTSASYKEREILKYLMLHNKKAIVVHRINECDERKDTQNVNKRVMNENLIADHTIFVSSWLRELFLKQGLRDGNHSIILNGSDREIFHPAGYTRWRKKTEPMRMVTHHWGANWLKGFDIYQRFDQVLGTDEYKDRFSFTYIGNLPKGFEFKNVRYIPPKHGVELADLLSQNHVYLTASQNEPGGNHQNEGANCGLPLLFRESGCMPEYCTGYGISFNENNFEQKLDEMANTYDIWVEKMKDYPNTADRMSEQYYQLFLDLLSRRDEVLARRKWPRRLPWLVKTLTNKR